MAAESLWVTVEDREKSAVRGISVEGTIVIGVRWNGAFEGIALSGERIKYPAGYYLDGGDAEPLEAADEPTSEGWERMRVLAFRALAEWSGNPTAVNTAASIAVPEPNGAQASMILANG
jgi:hypothetical protein